VHWQTTTINNSQGLLLKDNSGAGSAAIWHADHHLYGVAGSIKSDELQQLADSMAVR
jgi:HPt (histidine-containing phosphotransfer) domain-containing protein